MANYGKYYIAARLLLLKQYLEANNGRTRIIRAAHPRFVDKTPLKTQKRKHITTLLGSRMCFLVLF